MAFEAKIIKDSICNGNRLTTMQLTHPRIVHAEFNTHRMFSRNASSSRAIPFAVAVQKVLEDPFIPVWWGKNQKGMQAVEEIAGPEKDFAIVRWLHARDQAVAQASFFSESLDVHKQIVNRLIEPWSWITVCCTGDAGAWSNYFSLRCHKDAQPEIQKQAYMAQLAYYNSKPENLEPGDWHLPYILSEDYGSTLDSTCLKAHLKKVSVGRCARVSYLTQEGKRDLSKDVELHDRLCKQIPFHASPFEHVCEAMDDNGRYANYVGWRSYRYMMPHEYVRDFMWNHPDILAEISRSMD
jgi:hypothetical protein